MSARHAVKVNAPLYNPAFEHDACGVGFVARVSGQPDHDVLFKALQAVGNVTDFTIVGLKKDDNQVGVRAIDADGNRSPVAYPVPSS